LTKQKGHHPLGMMALVSRENARLHHPVRSGSCVVVVVVVVKIVVTRIE
jgi:hypothetical protein